MTQNSRKPRARRIYMLQGGVISLQERFILLQDGFFSPKKGKLGCKAG